MLAPSIYPGKVNGNSLLISTGNGPRGIKPGAADNIHDMRNIPTQAALPSKISNISEIVGGSVRLMLGMRPVVGHPIC